MQWPREVPPRYRVRNRSHWREPLAALAILLAPVAAYAGLRLMTPSPTTYDCRGITACVQVLPVCGPDVRVLADSQPVWYWGRRQPRNTPALLGFRPLLPTRITYRASWDSALLAVPPSAPGNSPLLREAYIRWPPQAGRSRATPFRLWCHAQYQPRRPPGPATMPSTCSTKRRRRSAR